MPFTLKVAIFIAAQALLPQPSPSEFRSRLDPSGGREEAPA